MDKGLSTGDSTAEGGEDYREQAVREYAKTKVKEYILGRMREYD
jgi:hypothetical protein